MYSGQRAWSGLHFAQLSYAMLVEKRSLQLPEEAPQDFRVLVERCLSRLPADRPNSQDLPTQLKALLAENDQWKDRSSL